MFRRSSGVKGDKEENSYTMAASRVDANGQLVIGPAALSQQYFGEDLRNAPSATTEITASSETLHDKRFAANQRAVAAKGLVADIRGGKLSSDELDFARVASQNPENKKA
jgi:hypothetical protein